MLFGFTPPGPRSERGWAGEPEFVVRAMEALQEAWSEAAESEEGAPRPAFAAPHARGAAAE